MVTSRSFIIALLILTPIWLYTMGGNTPPDPRYHGDYPGVVLSAATAEQLATRQTNARKELPPTPLCALPACRRVAERHLVTFGVCGGLTNQRLALIDGFMLAGLLGMSVALPQLDANGRQDAANGYAELQSQRVPSIPFTMPRPPPPASRASAYMWHHRHPTRGTGTADGCTGA